MLRTVQGTAWHVGLQRHTESRVSVRVQTLPRPMEGSGHWALCQTPGPCFSVHHYHQNHDKKTNNSTQKQGKLTLSKVSCWYFPWLERLGRQEFERIFSPLTQNFISKCCTFCSCFLLFYLWEMTLEGSGNFNSCSLSGIGGWSNSALFLRKGAAVGRAPGARQELPPEQVTEHFAEPFVHLQKGLCYLKGFEHVCACVWAIADRQGLEAGTKGRKNSKVLLKKSELLEKAEGMCSGGTVLAGNRSFKKWRKEMNSHQTFIVTVFSKAHIYSLHKLKDSTKDQGPRTDSITKTFPLRWEVTPSPKECPQAQASPQDHPTSLWGYKGRGVPTLSSW